MKILYLNIPQESFSKLVSGEFSHEWRQLCHPDDQRYVMTDSSSPTVNTEQNDAVPILYDAIRFSVNEEGYRGSILIKIDKIDTKKNHSREKNILSNLHQKGVEKFREIIFRLGNIIHKQIKIGPDAIQSSETVGA